MLVTQLWHGVIHTMNVYLSLTFMSRTTPQRSLLKVSMPPSCTRTHDGSITFLVRGSNNKSTNRIIAAHGPKRRTDMALWQELLAAYGQKAAAAMRSRALRCACAGVSSHLFRPPRHPPACFLAHCSIVYSSMFLNPPPSINSCSLPCRGAGPQSSRLGPRRGERLVGRQSGVWHIYLAILLQLQAAPGSRNGSPGCAQRPGMWAVPADNMP